MASLIVRRVDEGIVGLLKDRARRHGRSAEAEHRAILEAALRHTVPSAPELLAFFQEGGAFGLADWISSRSAAAGRWCRSTSPTRRDPPRYERGVGAGAATAAPHLVGWHARQMQAGSVHQQHHPGRTPPR